MRQTQPEIKKMVIIFDDNENYLGAIVASVRSMGCDVIGCGSPRELVTALEEAGHLDRAIVDKGANFMPGLIGWRGGLGAVRRIRDQFDEVPVMVVSGEGLSGVDEIRASGAGCFSSKAASGFMEYIEQFIDNGNINVFPEDVAKAAVL